MNGKRAAVMLAEGFEEGESLFTIDLLRRCGIAADGVSITGSLSVRGSHQITAMADVLLDPEAFDGYDMIIIPGGLPGATNLRDSKEVISLVQKFNAEGKYVAAICAGPIVLERAGILRGKRVTSYPADKYRTLFSDAVYVDDELVVADGNIVTSRGPATVFPFAFTLAELLGGDVEPVKEGTLYNMFLDDLRNRL